jgi:hypothetical protein
MWNYRRVISRPCPIVDLCIRRCGRLCNQGRRTGSHSVPRFCAGHSERRPETAWQPMDSSISAGFLGTVKLQTCISANQNVNACFLLFFFISSITAYVFFNLMEWWGGLLGKDRPIPLSKRFRFSGSCCSGSIFTQKKQKPSKTLGFGPLLVHRHAVSTASRHWNRVPLVPTKDSATWTATTIEATSTAPGHGDPRQKSCQIGMLWMAYASSNDA